MNKILLLILMISSAYGTTFRPLTVKSQVNEADNVYIGEVVSVSSDFEGSEIISKVFLKLDKWHGENVEHGHVEVYFPGGKVGDFVQNVEGSAAFEVGEKVALMSKTIEGRSWVMNLGLGKFSVKTIGNSYLLVNQIFPRHPSVGQIKLDRFESLVSSVKEVKLNKRFKNKYEITNSKSYKVQKTKTRRGRRIASLNRESSKKEKPSSLWLVFILLLLGVAKKIYSQKES